MIQIKNNEKHFKQKNKTPLHIASWANSKEIGELLISKGATVNAKDINDQCILMLFFMKVI